MLLLIVQYDKCYETTGAQFVRVHLVITITIKLNYYC